MKIVIVGGGTAGWLAALIISKIQPQSHSITVVESSKIGIIGAGEGSTGTLTNIIQNITGKYGCNEEDFVRECDVTGKLGIEFINWTGDNSSYISPIDGSFSSTHPVDLMFLHTLMTLPKDKWHLNSEDGFLIEHNKAPLSIKNGPAAYHFDAHKVGKYFKKVCGDIVKNIDAEVLDVILNEQGHISELKLSNDSTIKGDFFIDATGFSRILMKKLGSQWVSYKNNLPVDRAMPFLLPYEDGETIKPVTVAWAQNNGWMWNIPVAKRRGCGYVYSSEFVDDTTAQEELERTIGKKVDPIKIIKFESGRSDKLWIKNCMAVGLAAAFAEPLEATSIHTTIVQLENFVFHFLNEHKNSTCDDGRIDLYNERHVFMYDLLKDFLVLHYQGGRNDTEFWKYITAGNTLTDHVRSMIGLCKHRVPNSTLFPGVPGAAGWPLWSYILAGTGNLLSEVAKKEFELHRLGDYVTSDYDRLVFETLQKLEGLPDNGDAIRKRIMYA